MHGIDGGMLVGMYGCMRWMDTAGIRVMNSIVKGLKASSA
jgi:hypothetical protein